MNVETSLAKQRGNGYDMMLRARKGPLYLSGHFDRYSGVVAKCHEGNIGG